MKICEVYIDGYRNIRNTRISFLRPMAVLLSKNNYGKSNVLQGIKDGFDFICKNSQSATEYINSDYFRDMFNKCGSRFTFEVKFMLKNNSERLYRYSFTIGNMDKGDAFGICEEKLAYQVGEGGDERHLLKRELENPENVLLYGHSNDLFVTYSAFENIALLYLRAFSESPLQKKGDDTWIQFIDTLNEVRNVFRSLTEKNIGEFLAHEDTNLRDFSTIAENLESLKLYDKNQFDKFINCFLNLFPQYEDIETQKLADKTHLVFIRKALNKEETVETLSFGTRRILKLLYGVLVAESPLIFIEELENGIHPKLFYNVAETIYDILMSDTNKTSLIITSHSINFINMLTYNLDIIHFGPTEHICDDSEYINTRFARFARISEKGKMEIKAEVDRIRSSTGIGDFIYDYDDIPEKAIKLRGWMER